MHDTITRLHTALLADVRTHHPHLLDHPDGADILPVTIRTYDGHTGQQISVIVHQTPQLVPGWLTYLGLTDTALTVEHIGDSIWVRKAYATWRGHRVHFTSYENGLPTPNTSKENHR